MVNSVCGRVGKHLTRVTGTKKKKEKETIKIMSGDVMNTVYVSIAISFILVLPFSLLPFISYAHLLNLI